MKITAVTKNGRQVWMLDHGVKDGVRRRTIHPTEKAAKDAEAASLADTRMIGQGWATLPARGREETIRLLAEVEKSGASLRQVWEVFKAGNVPASSPALSKVIDEMIESKRKKHRRERYLNGLEDYLRMFARGRETLPIHQFDVRILEAWFSGRTEADSTMSSNMGRLSALFGYAARMGYIPSNPCLRLDKVTVEERPIVILSVRQAAKALVAARRYCPKMLPYVVLGMFAGLRPEEAQQMDWENVDMERAKVTVDAAASKRRRRRIVDLEPAAVAWLRKSKRKRGPIAPPLGTLRRLRRKIRDRARLPAVQDILRHTAASYLLALRGDTQRVCLQLDHSPRVLFRNYRELVTEEDCRKFWRLLPSKLRAGAKRRIFAGVKLENREGDDPSPVQRGIV